MKKIIAALAIPLMGMGMGASAQASQSHSAAYFSLGYGYHEQDDRFFGDDQFETGELIAKLGGAVTPWFGVELRAGSTINKHKDEFRGFPGIDGEYGIEYFYGIYAKLGWANSTRFTPYVIGGYTEGREEMEALGESGGEDFHDSSYGGGVDIALSRDFGLNLEYMFYYDKDSVTVKGPSASVVWKF